LPSAEGDEVLFRAADDGRPARKGRREQRFLNTPGELQMKTKYLLPAAALTLVTGFAFAAEAPKADAKPAAEPAAAAAPAAAPADAAKPAKATKAKKAKADKADKK